jgi:hypothetical protein
MAKFYGKVGYFNNTVEQTVTEDEVEIGTGIWVDEILERGYYGDILKEARSWLPSSEHTNEDLTVSNRISIVADDFAYANFLAMRYIIWGGVYWKVTNVEIQRPRLILSLGGVYNGTKASPPEDPS